MEQMLDIVVVKYSGNCTARNAYELASTQKFIRFSIRNSIAVSTSTFFNRFIAPDSHPIESSISIYSPELASPDSPGSRRWAAAARVSRSRVLPSRRLDNNWVCGIALLNYKKVQLFVEQQQFRGQVELQLSQMNRLHRNNTDILSERYPQHQNHFNKSPIRRQNGNLANPGRSPIRSRTPTRQPPLHNHSQHFPLKFISHLSPHQDPATHDNLEEFSNGKSIKYISHNLNDKNYQTRKIELSKKTDRITQEDNRLFGKLVDKLNSEKKTGLKSNDNSYKTSVFADPSDHKPARMDSTSAKNETSGVFRQLCHQNKPSQHKHQSKENSRPLENCEDRAEGLSCLVYKIKPSMKGEAEDSKQQRKSRSKAKDAGAANTPSILLKRKHSKLEQEHKLDSSPHLRKQASQRKEEEEDFTEFNNLLSHIEQRYKCGGMGPGEEIVKMSLRVQESLNMDPFI